MNTRKAPRLVTVGAVLLALLGAATIVGGIVSGGVGWLALGAALVALGIALRTGWRPAAGLVVLVGLVALLPGLYGLMGSFVVAQQIAMCASGSMASIAPLTSYPAGFCQYVNWFEQVGTGVLLIGVGAAGIVLIAAGMKHARSLSGRTPRGDSVGAP